MLVIRAEQMKALENARRSGFERALARHLQALVHPDAPHRDRLITSSIRFGMEQAPRFGLTTEAEVARFVEITAKNFQDAVPDPLPKPALAILCSYGLDASVKLNRYDAWATSHRQNQADGARGNSHAV